MAKIARTGVLVEECKPDKNSGACPSLDATYRTLELPNRELLAAPKADMETSIGMTTRPAVLMVALPNGWRQQL